MLGVWDFIDSVGHYLTTFNERKNTMSNELCNPRGVFHFDENPIAHRLDSLDQKIIGLIDNSKDNADLLLNAFYELIGKTNTIMEVHRIQKPGAPIPASFTREFLDKCDFVINAIGD